MKPGSCLGQRVRQRRGAEQREVGRVRDRPHACSSGSSGSVPPARSHSVLVGLARRLRCAPGGLPT